MCKLLEATTSPPLRNDGLAATHRYSPLPNSKVDYPTKVSSSLEMTSLRSTVDPSAPQMGNITYSIYFTFVSGN